MNSSHQWVETWDSFGDRLSYWEKKPVNELGGLAQLVAYGLQDQYLTGNPQITFTNREMTAIT
jgi:hypothetical protein